MPIYEYKPDDKCCPYCREGFELMQAMSDDPLTKCPECGAPCHRVISVPARTGKNILSNTNLAEKGFTKYVRRSDGQYTKEAGHGPDLPTHK